MSETRTFEIRGTLRALDRIGLVLTLSAPLLKATVVMSVFPGWDLDPFTFPEPSNGIGPAGAMACDLVMCVGVIVMLLARWLAGASLPLIPAVLFGIGSLGVMFNIFPTQHHSVADTWIGSAWLNSVLLGMAIATLPDNDEGRRIRAIVGAVFLGFVALLAVRGMQQVFIEHPETVADFRRNREAIFAAQGWSPESPMAKAYERRLMQPEATGWFGLANVYATFAAAGTVLSLVLAGAAVRSSASREGVHRSFVGVGGAVLSLVLSGTALYLAGGKGGYMAALVGVISAGAFIAVRSRRADATRRASMMAGGIIGCGVLAAVFVLIAVRGMIGDRMNELSLLFRWFYAEAALRIGVSNLPFGVGPDGFQRAYALAKNPLSPEDVTSSHNMLLDWFATLGVFGVAWIALWLVWIWRAGAAAAAPATAAPSGEIETVDLDRYDRWTVGAIGTFAVVAAVRIDQHVLTPDVAVMRLVGLVAFWVVGLTALKALRGSEQTMRLGLAGAAATVAAHGLIDVAGVWPSAASLACMMVGAAVLPWRSVQPRGRTWAGLATIGGIALLGVALFAATARVYAWESRLRASAAAAADVGTMRQHWREIVEGMRTRRPGAAEDARAFAMGLGVKELDPQAVETAMMHAEANAMSRASVQLLKMLPFKPDAETPATVPFEEEWKVRREASRIELRQAGVLRLLNQEQDAGDAEKRAEAVMADALPRKNQTSSELAWLALVRESIARGPTERETLTKAAEALEEAAKLAPYEMEYAMRLMRLYERVGDDSKAREWALKALQLDQGLKYDREIKGMSQRDREEAVRLSGGS